MYELYSLLPRGEFCCLQIIFQIFCKRSRSQRFGAVIIFLKEFYEKVNFDKMSADDNKSIKIPSIQRIKYHELAHICISYYFQNNALAPWVHFSTSVLIDTRTGKFRPQITV